MPQADNSKTITTLLDKYHIEWWSEGCKNVSPGSTNIQCPFCDDRSNHCGIFHDDLGYHCWRCDASGSFDYLLARITGQDIEKLREEISDLGFSFEVDSSTQVEELWRGSESQPEQRNVPDAPLTLPKYFDPVTWQMDFPLLDWYLNLRSYSRETPIAYQCGICSVGPWMNRMIIPVYFNHQLVSYQAADLTRRAQVKYKTAPGEINNFLYRWDLIDWSKRYIVLVEGVLDAWRFGDNALCTFGTHLTDRQKNLIIKSKIKKVYLSWDGDAWEKSLKHAEELNTFIPEVAVVQYPPEHDPDSYGRVYGVDALRKLVLES